VFDNHRLSRDGEPYPDPAHYLATIVEFVNSPQVLDFVRGVTSLDAIAWADAQATLYRPGDFLTLHDDRTGGHKRMAAYVLNMTPSWRAEWGGILQFLDEAGNIDEGYVPAFNALNLFRVPMLHSVSQVAIFGGLRYSITGWFHAR
jgi:Rps23 Pro-64 3,4-dihydroxylase Tpa1-like proline 4-hydroxylase